MGIEKTHTCCFIGPEVMKATEELEKEVRNAVEKLIVEEKVDTFLFRGKGKYENFCFSIVSKMKEKYPHIQRIKANVAFSFLDGDFSDFFMEPYYDDVYAPGRILNEKGLVYQGKQAEERIDMSGFCIVCDDAEESILEYVKQKDICIIYIGE